MQSHAVAGLFIVPNGTIIFELVAFLIVLFVLWKYVVPPVSKAMEDRQAMIARQIEESAEAKDRLAAAEAEYRDALAATKAEAARIREESRAEGQAIIDELRARARDEADAIRARGEEQLASERAAVIAELRAEIGTLAVELASKIVGESLADEARQSRVVERFLADVQSEGTSAVSESGH